MAVRKRMTSQRVIEIALIVSRDTGVASSRIFSRDRSTMTLAVRACVALLCRDVYGMSSVEIAAELDREHSTVLAMFKRYAGHKGEWLEGQLVRWTRELKLARQTTGAPRNEMLHRLQDHPR